MNKTALITGLMVLVVSIAIKIAFNMLVLWGVSALWGQGWDAVTLLKLALTVGALEIMTSSSSKE